MKTLKKLAFVLAALMALSCFAPMSAFATENTFTFDETRIGYSAANVEKVDTSSFTDIKDLTALPAANTVANYKITNAAGLVKLAELVNGNTEEDNNPFSGGTIYLANNINMSDVANFTPIGHTATGDGNDTPMLSIRVFCGTFDGQGFTIDNLTINGTTSCQKQAFGLFGVVKAAAIQNVVLGKNCTITVSGTNSNTFVGGIIGVCWHTDPIVVKNCYSAATVSGTTHVGGIVGNLHTVSPGYNVNIQYCTNAGTVTGTGRVGGVLGMLQNYSGTLIKSCSNIGTIKQTSIGTDTGKSVGGICGANNNKWTNETTYTTTTFIKNANYGKIEAKATPYAGGIIGCVRTCTLTDNTDYGVVTVGGVIQENTKVYGKPYDASSSIITEEGTNAVLPGTDKAIIHGYQIKENADNTNAVDIRFVGSIDSTAYSAVGMDIIVTYTYKNDQNQDVTVVKKLGATDCTEVYTSLNAMYNGQDVSFSAETLREDGQGYLFAVVLQNVPKGVGNLTVNVTPYCKDMAETPETYQGKPNTGIIDIEELPDSTVPVYSGN